MKRVAIVSFLHYSYNYGCFLTNYALKSYINSIGGFDSKIIRIFPDISSRFISNLKKGLKHVVIKVFKKVKRRLIGTYKNLDVGSRNKMFFEQIEQITCGDVYRDDKSFLNTNDLYDIFVVGSDQVWCDSGGNINAINIFFLKDITKPKISYAPSIGGGCRFDRNLVHHIVPMLNDFMHISVRESSGVEFLQEILDNKKDIFHAIDPTLLLSADEWSKIIDEHKTEENSIEEEYLFSYLLGQSQEHYALVKDFAKKKNLQILSFPHLGGYRKPDEDFAHIEIDAATPFEFLLYIKNAKYIFTDSFHAALFSGLFHKEFYVFNRDDAMFGRMIDLLNFYNAQDRYIPDPDVDVRSPDSISTDWNKLDISLEKRRKECQEWLKTALFSAAGYKTFKITDNQ